MKTTQFTPESFPILLGVLREGGIAVIPTDTIPGFAADATQKKALEKIAAIKGRSPEKPFLLLVPDFVAAERLCEFSPIARRLVKAFWPGKLTLVLPRKKGSLPDFFPTTPDLAIRLPGDLLLRKFLHAFGRPLVSTSVNLSGLPPLSSFSDIETLLQKETILIAEGKTELEGLPSTLAGVWEGKIVVYRSGSIPEHEILKYQ